jgi:hypothetical protein
MPYVKFIAGHTGTVAIRNYLEKNGRALAVDYLNLDVPTSVGNLGELPENQRFDWAAAMDATRREFGKDADWRGKRARTFKHYIFSPDPSDDLDVDSLRRLATAWAKKCFPDHEVAIVYHDDNAQHVLHAHIVVNNVNLLTGNRLREESPRALKRVAQELAEEMGLSFFRDRPTPSASADSKGKRPHPRTKQNVYKRKAEIEMEAKGGYSWVSDIRRRVVIARAVARNEQEFREMLGTMGVEVSDNSPKAKRRDWLYALADNPTRRVGGEKMGLSFGKQAILESFEEGLSGNLARKTAAEIAEIARRACELGDLCELKELSGFVDECAKTGARCVSDLEWALRAAQTKGDEQRASTLEKAIQYARDKHVLPQQTPSKPITTPKPKPAGKAAKPWEQKPWQEKDVRDRAQTAQMQTQTKRSGERNRNHGR